MKHQWKTDDQGAVKPFDEDSEHPVAECTACGTHSACLTSQEPGHLGCWADDGPKLDADDCEGVDLTVQVIVTIRHPGKAESHYDRCGVAQAHRLPLAQVIDRKADLVDLELGHLRAVMAERWRIAKAAHLADWQRAVSAAEGSSSGLAETDTKEGATTR